MTTQTPTGTGTFDHLDPPPGPYDGNGNYQAGNPRIADLVGRVVAAIGPKPARVNSAQWGDPEDGKLAVQILDRLLVFNRRGQIAEYPHYLIFQSRLRKTLNGRPITLARLVRPEQAYELVPLPPALRAKAAEKLVAEGWMTPNGQPTQPADNKPNNDDNDGFGWTNPHDEQAF